MPDPITRLNASLEGRYRIERELGAGGMATVYLADDLRHERQVAVKVLRPELAAAMGADRFLSEIKTTANLQHPNILPLFDSGEADGFVFYVMPYVEGESVRERLSRETQLPVVEASRIATQVAEALGYAHERGVIHRDIKPANILLSGGLPLVADFGIALAVQEAQSDRMTATGLSLGTAYYMSPEQAAGERQIDGRTDVYSLGCVLYEMLVGAPPYVASTTQGVLAKILQDPPASATAARRSIPANVDAAIRKALESLPADRFSDARSFARALTDPAFSYGQEPALAKGDATGAWRMMSVGASAVALLSLAVAGWALTRPRTAPPVERFETPFRQGQRPVDFTTQSFALSEDGKMLIYRGPSAESTARFWIRRWTDLEAQPVRGTDGGVSPALSPDGQSLAFQLGGEIRVASIEGGSVRTLGPGFRPLWGPEGHVHFGGPSGIVRMSTTDDIVEPVAELGEGHATFWPSQILPDRDAMLITIVLHDGRTEVGWLNLSTGEVVALANGSFPRLTDSGHLVFIADEGLVAAPFDPSAPDRIGPETLLVADVVAFALSAAGRLFYATVPGAGTSEFVWITRTGQTTPLDPGWSFDTGGGGNIGWSLSPDGGRLAMRRVTEEGSDIWIKDLEGGPVSRLTFHPGEDLGPRWTPDGRAVTFLSDRNIDLEVWSKNADGTGDAELVLDYDGRIAKVVWSPDGEWLVLRRAGLAGGAEGQRDILTYRPGTDRRPVPLIATPRFAEQAPAISPDGRWLAYTSDETGRNEVFVRPFPNVDDGKWQVSRDGGILPLWAHSGSELFYVDPAPTMMAAQITTRPTFAVERLDPLFVIPPGYPVPQNGDPYDVSIDDQRFLMARVFASDVETAQRVVLVNNFSEELRNTVPN